MTKHEHPPVDVSTVVTDLRVVLGQLLRRMRQQSPGDDLTKSQSAVLGRIERDGPTTATALAHAEGIRPQSMGAIVTALEQAGYVTGAPDPRDGRKTILSLTDTAREHYRSGRLAKEDWITGALTATLTPAEIAELASSIDLLRRIATA
ncbi:MarR family winged helix-turn-helix transcriptional regulator [Frondihabitans cladoniiphilus]|uniref:HTH marR-type domain-containing protein n=1 Tax=Frondihabitans cladoniiphilus TaxID=715785 RepID=A0ABP8VJ00_9MICO